MGAPVLGLRMMGIGGGSAAREGSWGMGAPVFGLKRTAVLAAGMENPGEVASAGGGYDGGCAWRCALMIAPEECCWRPGCAAGAGGGAASVGGGGHCGVPSCCACITLPYVICCWYCGCAYC